MLHLLLLIAPFFQISSLHQETGQDSQLTPHEISWLIENDIRFAPNSSWPPGDFMDEQGNHSGIVADYIRIFEEKLGITFQKISYQNWSEMLDGLENAEADFVGAMHRTDEREQFLLFTEPFIQLPNVILTRNDYPFQVSPSHIRSMTLAAVAEYASADYVRETYPDAVIIEYEDDLTAVLQTSLGITDGTIIDVMTASYLVEKYGISNLKLGLTLDFEWNVRMAIRKDLPELHSILSKLLAQIDDQQQEEIFNRWVNIDLIQEEGFFERNQTKLIGLIAFLIFAAVSVTLHNYDLKKQVKERTRDLQSSLDEKEILLTEIHHRVKNNLAITASLLQLEMMHIEDNASIEILTNSVMRIDSISLVHEKLYQSSDFKNIPIHSYLHEHLEHIEDKFNEEKRIRVRTEVDEFYMNINLAIPAALLINELVTNAFKHAFPDQREGVIDICFKNRGDNIIMSVEDDGIGLPEIIDPDDQSSVGFILVSTFSRQLEAEYEVRTRPGTKFTFTFNAYDKKGSGGNMHPAKK